MKNHSIKPLHLPNFSHLGQKGCLVRDGPLHKVLVARVEFGHYDQALPAYNGPVFFQRFIEAFFIIAISPFTFVMNSPTFSPIFSAAESGITPKILTPSFRFEK